MNKLRFYFSLYSARLGWKRRGFTTEPGDPAVDLAPRPLRVFFWTPVINAGAKIIVHDMLPTLRNEIALRKLPWRVEAGSGLPEESVDILISFKTLPDASKFSDKTRHVLLICDQVELFWEQLRIFDAIVATASRPLAQLLANQHPKVSFIPETETPENIEFGTRNLNCPPSARQRVLMWHGGHYSLAPLRELRPYFECNEALNGFELHIVSGGAKAHEERWGRLVVRHYPWSEDQLYKTAAQARLGIAPAHSSVRRSWLKPASRIRSLYGLGVPAIGDANVPDVVAFAAEFGGPTAKGPGKWNATLTQLLNRPQDLDRLACTGHAVVASNHSGRLTAERWINYLNRS